jgi:hypothetical protein
VLLAYRLPREPSTPRVTIWRKLSRLGAVQILDGLVGLPADARTKEQLEWLADEVIESGGEATIWVGRPGSAQQERAIAQRMATAVAADYRLVAADAEEALAAVDGTSRRRTLGRLRRELRRVAARDFFPPPERETARYAVERLAASTEADVAGVER